jgi:hypothetical protein
VGAVRQLSTTCPFEGFALETKAELGSPKKESHMGRDKVFGDVVVPADALDSMISKLEEALAGLEGAFAGMWSYLLPDAKICLAELELIREVIQGLKQRAAQGPGFPGCA